MWRIIKTMMIYTLLSVPKAFFVALCYLCMWRIAVCSGGSKNFEKGGKTIYQLRPHLSQMRTTKYMLFARKKAAFWKKIWANRGQPPHRPPPFEYATGCLFIALHSVVDCNGFRWRRVWCWAVDSLWQTNWQLFMCWSRHSASWCTVCSQCWSRILPW